MRVVPTIGRVMLVLATAASTPALDAQSVTTAEGEVTRGPFEVGERLVLRMKTRLPFGGVTFQPHSREVLRGAIAEEP